jgi:hypothetical protein
MQRLTRVLKSDMIRGAIEDRWMDPVRLILRAREIFDTIRFAITYSPPDPGKHPLEGFFAKFTNDDEMVSIKIAMYALDKSKDEVMALVAAGQLSSIRVDRPPPARPYFKIRVGDLRRMVLGSDIGSSSPPADSIGSGRGD